MSASPDSDVQTSVSLRSVSVVTFFSVGQLLVLFALQLVLARLYGASREFDAYLAAMALPQVISAALAGSLGAVVVPLYNELQAKHQDATVDTVLNRLGWMLLAVAGALSLMLFVLARPLAGWLYSDFQPDQMELTVELTRILCWLLPLNVVTSLLFSIFHCRRKFLLPACSGVIGPGVTVAVTVALDDWGVRGVAWAMLSGGLVGVLLLSSGFPRSRDAASVAFRPALQRFVVLLWPLLVGAAYFRLDPIVDRHLASRLTDGSISQLHYAWQMVNAVSLLAASGLSVVAFPAIARQAAAGERRLFVSELAHSWRFLCVVLTPLIGGILCFSRVLIDWLLERGEFTAADTAAVSGLMNLYVGALFAAGVGEVAARAFYALGNTWTPTLIGMFGFTLGVAAKLFCVDAWQTAGIAGVTSAYYLLNAALLLTVLRMRLSGPLFENLGITTVRTVCCTAISLGLAWLIVDESSGLRVLAGVTASVVLYFALQLLFGDEFAVRIARAVFRRPVEDEAETNL